MVFYAFLASKSVFRMEYPLKKMARDFAGVGSAYLGKEGNSDSTLQVFFQKINRAEVLLGDIIVFRAANGKRIIHRVVSLNPLQTRGDHCVHEDLPVPEESPVFRAVSYRRCGKQCFLSNGQIGLHEFRKHQRTLFAFNILSKCLYPFLLRNPFRISARCLSKSVFQDNTVYYWRKHPVGWTDKEGWHWMRFARYFVEKPQADHHD